jgi:hypothetical protein
MYQNKKDKEEDDEEGAARGEEANTIRLITAVGILIMAFWDDTTQPMFCSNLLPPSSR